MKNYKDIYSENFIIKQVYEFADKVRIVKDFLKDRRFNAVACYDTDGVYICMTRKDGYQVLFYYKNPIYTADIISDIATYLSKHGGIKQWQIPKN